MLQKAVGSEPKTTAEADTALIASVVNADQRAYAALVQRYLPRVSAVTRRMLIDDGMAEDAAQEAMLRLWTHAASFDPSKASLSTWLTRVTVNICLDRLRKRQEEQWPENHDVAMPADQESSLLQDQLAKKLEAAMSKLPERQRLALILCHYEEMSMADAASAMDATVEAVESLLGRARRGLKQQLASEWRMLLAEDASE